MKKQRTTQKAIKEQYTNILYCGYCDLQRLLKFVDAEYYTARAEGWASDIYIINSSTCIVTGYAPFGNIKIDFNTCKKYEQKALAAIQSIYNYEEQKAALNNIIDELIQEVTQK